VALFITLEPAERKQRSGGSPPHEVAEAFHRTVNCRISMRSARAGADGAGRHQRHRHSTGDAVARPVAFVPPQYYSRAAHMVRVLGKGCEHFVLRIRSSLRVTGFVFADYIDPHGFHRFKRPGRFSTPPMFAGIKDTALSSVEQGPGRTRGGAFERQNRWLRADAGQERFVQKRTASEWNPRRSHYREISGYAPSPYCFILRHSVTVLIFNASAAWRRFPRKRSSARSIMARSCA
jgi:hypothetical protein